MSKLIRFGEDVDGYNIPVLNEREIRAAAGLWFLMLFTSVMFVSFKENFIMFKFSIIAFLIDFIIRVLINPKFSPSLILGRLIVRNQTPEYVGAPQKKFAWVIGLVLATIMFVHLVIVNAFSPITGIICLACLIFLFFESAFGICLGCKFYPMVYKEKAQYCPGEVCDVKSKQAIQKTTKVQISIVFVFLIFMALTVLLFHANFRTTPYDLFGIEQYFQSK